jgi:arsenite oxidase small subunit|tara:strand:+ start:839 stop:1411 length:573 start_codon:yes stop_codon:yes gene_type:complete
MAPQTEKETAPDCQGLNLDVTRRQFLFIGGVSLVALSLPSSLGFGGQQSMQAMVAAYPRTRIGSVSELKLNDPVTFKYPYDNTFSTNYLYKLGAEAGGGVGADKDIVAFNTICPHQGGFLQGRFNPENQVLGPCPLHLTTFDLTRHGMVVSGHATQGVPQITLEVEGDDIYATGVLGLIYSFYDNNVAPA